MPLERRLNIIVREHDSIVEILLLEDGVPIDSSGITRCDITFKRPGQSDVTFSSTSAVSSYWFEFQREVLIDGAERLLIRCNFRDLPIPPINGRWTCYVYLWDADEVDGRLWGTFEVEIRGVPGVSLTSRPYPIESLDSLNLGIFAPTGGVIRKGFFHPTLIEEFDMAGRILEGLIFQVLRTYSNYPPEELDLAGSILLGSLGTVTFRSYDEYEPEELDLAGEILSGDLDAVLQTYTFTPVDSMNLAGTIRSGTLTTL